MQQEHFQEAKWGRLWVLDLVLAFYRYVMGAARHILVHFRRICYAPR